MIYPYLQHEEDCYYFRQRMFVNMHAMYVIYAKNLMTFMHIKCTHMYEKYTGNIYDIHLWNVIYLEFVSEREPNSFELYNKKSFIYIINWCEKSNK